MSQLTAYHEWLRLNGHAEPIRQKGLPALLQAKDRLAHFSARHESIFIDFSRQSVDEEILSALLKILELQNFDHARAALFAGEAVNLSENRAALHMALRGDAHSQFAVKGQAVMHSVMPAVLAARAKALHFAEAVRAQKQKGCTAMGSTGQPITHIVHVGIGGSDLGPRLLVEALKDEQAPEIIFMGNCDGYAVQSSLQGVNPAHTLVLIASKTFTTLETMRNAATCKAWLEQSLGDKALLHMAAITAAPATAKKFGIADNMIFEFWDWVGGRFSVSSTIALPAMMAMGKAAFENFLAGMASMDAHFLNAPLRQNLPVLLAVLDVWNGNAMGYAARAVIPYCERLKSLPAYLEQLEMESLGKSVDRQGQTLSYQTAPVVFGITGTPAQHAFMQAMHQGTQTIPADIFVIKYDDATLPEHHTMLLANALAQAEALAFGKISTHPEKTVQGNRPSTLCVIDKMDSYGLGQLLALYEHKVFALSVFWDINPFDQWGVELGKNMAGPIQTALAGDTAELRPALAELIGFLRKN